MISIALYDKYVGRPLIKEQYFLPTLGPLSHGISTSSHKQPRFEVTNGSLAGADVESLTLLT